jgi:hypothetical protein
LFTDSSRDETPGQAAIDFDARRFVWHRSRPEASEHFLAVLSVVVRDGNDYGTEQILMNRFLSALCYVLDQPMSVVVAAAAGFKSEVDPPLLGQPVVAPTLLLPAPAGIVVAPDQRLRLVLALFREGRTAESAFYRFLALYNALDATFDNHLDNRDGYIRACLQASPVPRRRDTETFDSQRTFVMGSEMLWPTLSDRPARTCLTPTTYSIAAISTEPRRNSRASYGDVSVSGGRTESNPVEPAQPGARQASSRHPHVPVCGGRCDAVPPTGRSRSVATWP